MPPTGLLSRWRAVVLLATASPCPWRTEAFTCPVESNVGIRKGDLSMAKGRSADDCCAFCDANAAAQCQCQCQCNAPNSAELSSIVPIHTSRRKFVQCAAAAASVGPAAAFASPAAALAAGDTTEAAGAGGATSLPNLVAVPGPSAPFSSVRKYRNLVLSNGMKVVLVKDSTAQRSAVALAIDGAGQFAEPEDIPGLAHLMEHVVLSSSRGTPRVPQRRARRIWNPNPEISRMRDDDDVGGDAAGSEEEDFQDWLVKKEGDSNAFTAPGFVCFHFNGPHEILPEGLERFAGLFTLDEVGETVRKPGVVRREIGRVASEFDNNSDASRAFYFLKSNINPRGHPFARFSAGSRATLQTTPAEEGIDVKLELLNFFRDHYLSSRATLVVIGKDELSAMDRWISPFSNVMSQKARPTERPSFPDAVLGARSESPTQSIILRSKAKDDIQIDENCQTLCIEWPLSFVYPTPNSGQLQTTTLITAPAVGFVLTQIISRRGPGSLRFLLERFGWVPVVGSKGVPRISFPVDVSGFQVLRMELGVTLEGFRNRSAVVSAVFESIRKVIERPLQLDLIKQYLAAGLLHGHLFAPRPADSIALAVDSLRYGVGGSHGIANPNGDFYLMPSPEDEIGAESMRQTVTETLRIMSDEKIPLVSFRASPKAIFGSSGGLIDKEISSSPLFSPWRAEPITRARYLVEGRASGASGYFKSLSWFTSNFDGYSSLSPPYLNPLLPTKFRAPRPFVERRDGWKSRYFYAEDASAYEGSARPVGTRESLRLADTRTWREFQTETTLEGSNWKLWHIPPGRAELGLPLPVRAPEPSIECCYVVQLLSSLPSAFTSRQLALANLWLLSFDDEILDLAELGATAGKATDLSCIFYNSSKVLLTSSIAYTFLLFQRSCLRIEHKHIRSSN